MTPEAATYLHEALDYIQHYSLRRAALDWNAIRFEALARISTAQTAADTHPTLRWVLSCLDRHSFLLSPEQVQKRMASSDMKMKPEGWPLEPDIGYLELPSLTGNEAVAKAYAQTIQQFIRDFDQAAVHQWIVDLRRNRGGTMWPMVVGVCPLLGNGEYGFFLSPEGKQTNWTAHITRSTKKLLAEPYSLTHPASSMAVLTSRRTCSAGEFTLLAFRGDPRVRSFGEPTAGLPTANRSKTLSDGAQLALTVALGADRTGRSYDGPIAPDQLVDNDWTLFQTERDPVLLAAVEWLRMRYG